MQVLEISGLIEEGMWVDTLIQTPRYERIATTSGLPGWEQHRLIIFLLVASTRG